MERIARMHIGRVCEAKLLQYLDLTFLVLGYTNPLPTQKRARITLHLNIDRAIKFSFLAILQAAIGCVLSLS